MGFSTVDFNFADFDKAGVDTLDFVTMSINVTIGGFCYVLWIFRC